ncbi:hypothetical protein SLS62_002688 [Diatrype stigma]|uniref:Uncharacterized protein n=1 Tax=Diatrype stigma TaxID=117547 RepID=A0AAN9V7Y3_9PEZI
MQAERGATLVPAINANAWEQGIASRLVLFRNWAIQQERHQSAYFAGIQKLDGRLMPGAIGPIFAKLGETGFELPDSEDDDYGWEDEDAAEIPPVPQWQGSEDILLGNLDDDGNQSDGDSEVQPHDPGASPQ